MPVLPLPHTATLGSRQAPARIVRAGRSLVTRAEIARLSGVAKSTLAALYSHRGKTGHPPVVHTHPEYGTLYFDEEETLRWHRGRQGLGNKVRVAGVRHSGDPDELVTSTEAARILGYGPATIRGYLARYPGYFPWPDEIQSLPGGRERKLWRRATVWAFASGEAAPRTSDTA